VLRLRAGSIIIDLEVTPEAKSTGFDLHQELVEQAKDARSDLMTGNLHPTLNPKPETLN
jgi:hypothetical protein